MEAVETFGINPVLLVAQIVNFLILLFILKRFMYKPLLKVLEERKNKIALSLKNAEEIEQRLARIEKEHEVMISKASAEAKSIIANASQSSEQIIGEAKLKAGKDADRIIEKAEETLESERAKLYQEIRSQVANMVAEGLEKSDR